MTDPQHKNAERFKVPEHLWDLVGAFIGAMIGASAGAGLGIALVFVTRDWIIVPTVSICGAMAGGLLGNFAGGSAGIALDVYARIVGRKSRIPLYVGFATGGMMLVLVMFNKQATWPVYILAFMVFWVAGYVIGGLCVRAVELVKLIRSR